MTQRLGSNPLASLGKKSELVYLKKGKVKTIEKKCIYLKYREDKYYCDSPSSRLHGFLGNEAGAKKKCEQCHVRVIK